MTEAKPHDGPGPSADTFNPNQYIWDGETWWTSDRKQHWDGLRWRSGLLIDDEVGPQPDSPESFEAMSGGAMVQARRKVEPKFVPTSWTKPLQIAVIAYFATGTLFGLAELPSMTFIGQGIALIYGLIVVGLGLLVAVGVVRRMRWVFEVIWVLLLFNVGSLLFDVVRGNSLTYGLALPAWAGWGRIVQIAAGGALALTMLYVRRERGPWGMTQQLRRHTRPEQASERPQT